MFTGLVQALGTLRGRQARGQTERLEIAGTPVKAPRSDMPNEAAWWSRCLLGESIAVAGACLTVAEVRTRSFVADVSAETLSKTTLASLGIGASVNLERALTLGAPLGGHLVLGHVDGVGRVERLSDREGYRHAVVSVPPSLEVYLAPKGSVTLDGVSLTINNNAAGTIELMLVPHTLAATTLGAWRPGAKVNVEIDPLARYAVHYLQQHFEVD